MNPARTLLHVSRAFAASVLHTMTVRRIGSPRFTLQITEDWAAYAIDAPEAVSPSMVSLNLSTFAPAREASPVIWLMMTFGSAVSVVRDVSIIMLAPLVLARSFPSLPS